MSFIQILPIIIFSSWHYGKLYFNAKTENISFLQIIIRILFVLTMSYMLHSWVLLCCIIITSKFLYDTIVFVFDVIPGPSSGFFNVNSKYKNCLNDGLVGLLCCFAYIIMG
jgi:hypothetical protein